MNNKDTPLKGKFQGFRISPPGTRDKGQILYDSNLPLLMVSLSAVSVTPGQPWSENIVKNSRNKQFTSFKLHVVRNNEEISHCPTRSHLGR